MEWIFMNRRFLEMVEGLLSKEKEERSDMPGTIFFWKIDGYYDGHRLISKSDLCLGAVTPEFGSSMRKDQLLHFLKV